MENAGKYFMTGYLHSAKLLKDFSANFILKNFNEVKNTDEMRLVRKDPKALFEILEFNNGKN